MIKFSSIILDVLIGFDLSILNAKKILLLLSDRIGDTLFATPAIGLLAQRLGDCCLDAVVVNQMASEVVAFNPNITTVWQSPSKAVLKRLDKDYDRIISFSRNQAIKTLAEQFQKTEVIFFEEIDEPMPRYEFFVNYIDSLFPEKANCLPPAQYQLFPQASHYQQAEQLLSNNGISRTDKLIVCHLGCHRMAKLGKKFWRRKLDPAGSKSWFTERYVELNQRIMNKFPGYKLLLVGTAGERKLANDLLSMPNVIDIIGQTDLLTLAAVIKKSRLLLTCDTGPLHIACAMGTPLIGLFGKTDSRYWGPYPKQADRITIQAVSMEAITVDHVYAAVLQQLSETSEVVA